MLKMINFSGVSETADHQVIAHFNGTVKDEAISFNMSIADSQLFVDHKDEVDADFADFNQNIIDLMKLAK